MSFANLFPGSCVQVPGGQTQGFINPPSDQEEDRLSETPREGDDYVEQYLLEEEEEELRMQEGHPPASGMNSNSIFDVEELTSVGTMPNVAQLKIDEVENKLFNDYRLKPGEFQKLPVFLYQTKLLGLINTNPVVVIKGRTGCGKSTQVPLMILDDYSQRKQFCNIVVTQPRRIAAISLTKTVCKIYDMKLGSLIGYQIGLDRQVSPQTRLTYCTTGVLLQKLVRSKSMDEFTHIILDEVHERTQEMDFLMLLVRKLQKTNSRNVKIILMSATIDVDPYAKYFSRLVNQVREAAPVISIEKENIYKVQIYYLEHLENQLGDFPESSKGDHDIAPEAYGWVIKLIKAFDMIDEGEKKMKGSVLVFLPGIHEIESMFDALQRNEGYAGWFICPLHSTITADEQMKVFQPPPKNKRKVILSTNIAESSITVNDIKYVIDFCLTKSMRLDEETNLSSLRLCSASQSMCEQRAGRAGRVMDGRVYRLVRKHFYQNLPYESNPEMLNASLEQTVLKAKQLEMGEPKKVLALAMDPPDLTNLKKTILKLKEIGAMFLKVEEKYNEDDGELTVMGHVMASLPLDVQMTKLILLGHIFNVLNDAIIMACSMSVKSMFSRPFQKDEQSYMSKLTWANSSCSDPIACVNAYNTWRSSVTSGKFNISKGQTEVAFAQRYFIQLNAMREVAKIVEEVTQRLKEFNVVQTRPPEIENWQSFKYVLLRVILAGACYPNFFTRGEMAGQVNEREAVKLLGARDPFNTVYLTNFPHDQPGPLYASAIKKLFRQCGVPENDIKISFDGSSRVYVEFISDSEPSVYNFAGSKTLRSNVSTKIAEAVYRAVKLRHGKIKMDIPMLRVDEANRRLESARKQYLERQKSASKALNSILPSIDVDHIEIEVTHIDSITNFYAQQKNAYTTPRVSAYHNILNQQAQLKKPSAVLENEVYAAPYLTLDDGNLYRCKVLSVEKRTVRIIYIDFGNIEILDASLIYALPKPSIVKSGSVEISVDLRNDPPLAFQCRLAHIQSVDSTVLVRGRVVNQAKEFFRAACLEKPAVAKVYSVVDNIVSMVILKEQQSSSSMGNRDGDYVNFNQLLVEKNWARPAEESFLSKLNHDLRVKHQSKYNSYNNAPYDVDNDAPSEATTQTPFANDSALEMIPPTEDECGDMKMHLKGPFSPLEMKMRGCLRSSINKAIVIEKDSINSVLLDDGPENHYERLLVASHVSRSAGGDRLLLRHTTMLPDIQGLPAFLCLLFAPYVELRVDEDFTRLTGAICGLGYDPDKMKSYFPEHDFEVAFDTVFSLEEIEMLNKLRRLLSLCLAPPGETAYHNTEVERYQKLLLDLIQKSFCWLRHHLPERVQQCNSYKWGQISEDRLMYPGTKQLVNTPLIYNLIFGVDLAKTKVDLKQLSIRYQKNIDDITKIKDGLKPFKPMSCDLCQAPLDNIQVLRMHFMSRLHIQLSERYNLTNPSV